MNTTPDVAPAAARPRRVSGVRLLLGLFLLITCPVAGFFGAGAMPYKHPLIYALLAGIQLVLLAYAAPVLFDWIRATRPSRLRDVVPVLCTVLAGGSVLAITEFAASRHGIRGSTLALVLGRFRSADPLTLDLLHSAAAGAGLLVLVIAAAAGLLLLRRAPWFRRALGRAQEVAVDGAEQLSAAADGWAPEAGPGPPVVTREADGFRRRHLPPVTLVLMVLGALVTLASILVFSLQRPDPATSELLTIIATFASLPAMASAVLASLWRRDAELGIIMAALHRTAAIPVVTAAVCFLPLLLASFLPPVWQGFAAQQIATIGGDGLMPPGTPLPLWTVVSAITALALGMTACLGLCVFVVMPIVAIFMPQVMIAGNWMSTAPEHRRKNIAAARGIVGLVVLIFVFGILVVDTGPGDLRFWLAIVCLPAMVALMAYIGVTQEVDRPRRRRHRRAQRGG